MLIVVTIMALLMVVAIPAYKDMVMHTEETAAMQAIRTLHTARMQCFSQNNHYAASLRELAGKWITADLASGVKGGYKFRLDDSPSGYVIHAEPVKYGVNGKRTFYSDETMILRQHEGLEPANADSEEAK
jgi:Tfp pilus assembly protein PilE